ncbi:MAG: penicillin-binding protein activator [Candidatus Paceibacterota bacterium]|jgi:branched-chain amino acid transport system substrate-binding protein
MSKTYKWLIVIIVIIIIIAGIWYLGAKPATPAVTGPIKIGAILPLTGGGSFFGVEQKQGMDLANQESKIKISYEDSETDATKGTSAFMKLLSTDRPDVAVVSFSSVASAIMPLAVQEKMPTLQTVVSAPNIAAKTNYSLRYFTSAPQEAPIAANLIVSNLKDKKVAVLYENSEYGKSYFSSLKTSLEALGAKVVASENFLNTDKDFRTQITKLKASNPEALYIVAMDKSLALIFPELKEAGVKAHLVTNWVLANPSVIEKVGQSANGAYLTSPSYYLDQPSELTANFKSQYKSVYGQDPSAYAAIGYDTVRLLAKLPAGIPADQFKAEFIKIGSMPGAMGDLKIDQNGEITFALYPVQIINQKLVPLTK